MVSVVFLVTSKILEYVAFVSHSFWKILGLYIFKYFFTLPLFSYLYIKLFDIAHQPSGVLLFFFFFFLPTCVLFLISLSSLIFPHQLFCSVANNERKPRLNSIVYFSHFYLAHL